MSETFNFLNLLLVIAIECNLRQFCKMGRYQARVRGGGGGGGAAPPHEIEKQKKSHQSKFKTISPIFCYFFSRKYHLLCYFLSWAPLEKL